MSFQKYGAGVTYSTVTYIYFTIFGKYKLIAITMQTCDDEENFLAEVQTPTDGLAILENMFQLLIFCVLYGKAE